MSPAYKNSHLLNVHRFKNIFSCKDDFSILPPLWLDVKYIPSHRAVRERPSLPSQREVLESQHIPSNISVDLSHM